MVQLVSIISNDPGSKTTTYLGSDGQEYTLSGDLSARANNPGNISPTGQSARGLYESQYGVIGYLPSSNGPPVAVFSTLENGRAAQQYLWSTDRYQNKTLEEAAKSWAEKAYPDALAKAAGVSKDTLVRDLTPEQMQAIFAEQVAREGKSNLRVADAQGNRLDPAIITGANPVPPGLIPSALPPTPATQSPELAAQRASTSATVFPSPVNNPPAAGGLPASSAIFGDRALSALNIPPIDRNAAQSYVRSAGTPMDPMGGLGAPMAGPGTVAPNIPYPATMSADLAGTRSGFPPLPLPAPLVAPRLDAVTPMPAFSEVQAFGARPAAPPPVAPMQNPVAERESMWSLMDQLQAQEAMRGGDQTVTRADPWSVPGAIAIADPANPPSLGGGAVSSGMLNDWITQQTLQAADTVYREPGGDMPMASRSAVDPWSIPGLMDAPGLSNTIPTPMDLAAGRGGYTTGEGLNVRPVETVQINPATGLPMVARAEVPAATPGSSWLPSGIGGQPSMFHTGGTITVRPDGSSSFAPPLAGSMVAPAGRPASVPSPAELQAAVPEPRGSWLPSAAVGRAALPQPVAPAPLSTPLVREVKGPPLPPPLPNQPNGTIVANTDARLAAVPKPASIPYKPNTPYNHLTPQQKLEIMRVGPARPLPPMPVARPQRAPVVVQRPPVARPFPRPVMVAPIARPAFNNVPIGQEWMRGISSAPSQTFEGAFPGALI